jgi:hypothetical protein
MPAAVIGGAIAAVGAVGSAVVSSRGASAAANATTQAADQAAQVTRETYNQSAQALAPWQQQGLQANALLNDSLGIGTPQQPQIQPMGAQGGFGGQYGMGGGQFEPMGGIGGNWRDRVGRDLGDGQGLGGNMPNTYSGPYAANGTPQGTAPSYQNAFGNWLANSDYGFQFANGSNAVNSGYAGAGSIKSGAAMKGMERFRQGLQQGFRGEYNALLGNQQSLGFGAASAQAGVSQNMGNSLSQIYQNRGDNIANARLVGASNTSNAIGSAAGIAANLYGRYG